MRGGKKVTGQCFIHNLSYKIIVLKVMTLTKFKFSVPFFHIQLYILLITTYYIFIYFPYKIFKEKKNQTHEISYLVEYKTEHKR